MSRHRHRKTAIRGRAPDRVIVIGIAFLFVGGILLAIGGRTLVREWRYKQYAVRSEAIATGKSLQFATDTSGTAYEISYRWPVDGTAVERTERVSVHVWERTEPGSALPIEHLPGRLETARVVSDRPARNGSAGVFAAVGAVLVLAALVTFTRAVRLGSRSDADVSGTLGPAVPIAPAGESSYWTLARRSSGFWLGAIFLLVGTPLFIGTVSASVEEWRFSHDVRSTQGMVLTKEVRRSGKRHRGRTYEATYRFTVAEATFENRTALPHRDWGRLREREPARVLYLADDPAKSRLAGQGSGVWIVLAPLIGAVFAGVGATIAVRAIRNARLEWHLRRPDNL
jgi:hypothetical protein